MGLLTSILLASSCLVPPVDAPVADPFRLPGCVWCPGNRGIEYATTPGTEVRAASSETVSFSGDVADVHYVVVSHADGTRTTYGDLRRRTVQRGQQVEVGDVVGLAGESLHFGLRQGDEYVDPTPLLGTLWKRPHLVPTDGTPPRTTDDSGVCIR